MKFLNAVLAFFPLFSISAIAPRPSIQFENKNSYQYVTLIRDNKLECVSSLTGKIHLLPDFVSASVEEKGSAVLLDPEQSLDPILAAFPVCSKERENFIFLSSSKMTERPVQIAGYWMPAFQLAAYGINCFTSFKAGEYYGHKDFAYFDYGIVALATALLPFVSLKSPLVCAGAGNVISYLTKEDSSNIFAGFSAFQESLKNEHPYLNSVVTVHKKIKISGMPFSALYESLDDSTAESETEGENESGLFDDRFFQAGLGSGFFVDKDKIITNYHVIKSKFKKNEYEAKYVIELADGSQISVKEILAQDEERDLALLQTAFSGGTPARLGDSDKLNLLDEVVIAGAPLGFKNSLAKGHISQIRGGKGFIQYTAPTSQGNSGGALFLADSQELIGIPTLAIDTKFSINQNLNFAIPVNDVKKFLEENGF